mgnify:CR=1 FL=1
MSTHDMREKLHPYLDGELSEPETLEIEAAIKADPALKEELEELKAVTLMARAALEGPAQEADLSQVFAGVKRQLEAEALWSEAPSVASTEEESTGVMGWLANTLGLRSPMPAFAGALAFILIGGLWLGGAFDSTTVDSEPQLAGHQGAPVTDKATAAETRPAGKRRGIETETVRQTAFVDHVETSKGRVVVDVDTQNPSRPIVIWHHVDAEAPATPESPRSTPPKEL